MKAVYIQAYGSSDELVYGELGDPSLVKGEVLIKVAFASVNPVDWKIREGRLKFLSGKKFPLFMGTELTGVVVAIGDGVKSLKLGDKVFAGLSHKGGAYAELVSVPERKVHKLPDELPLKEASTIAVAGLTPMQAFTLHYKVKEGDRVLINGASGGVGTYAVQIAKVLGAHVTAVCSERNFDLVRSLGADELIDYNKEDFMGRREAYDVVLDAAANAFFPEAKGCLKKGGMLIKLNMSVKSIFLGFWTQLFASKRLKMILVKDRAQDFQWMVEHLLNGSIRVIMDKVYPLSEAKEAQEYSASGRARGKIVLEV